MYISNELMKKIIYINFLITLLLLIFSELFLRHILGYNVQGISKNVLNTDGQFTFNNKNLTKSKVFGAKIFTDVNGFRVPKKPKKTEKKDKNKIFFIGGSVTFGNGVSAEDTFVEKLNEEADFLIVNASVVGSSLENNYKIFSNIYEKKKTEKVFISLAVDDIRDFTIITRRSNTHKESKPITFVKKIKSKKIFVNINSFLRANFVSYVFFKTFLLNSEKQYFLQELVRFKDSEFLNKFSYTLEKFTPHKDKITFFIIPYSEQVTSQGCKKRDITQDFFEKELNSKNLNFINLKEQFCNHKKNKKLFLKNDHAHLSKKGHELIFTVLKKYLN